MIMAARGGTESVASQVDTHLISWQFVVSQHILYKDISLETLHFLWFTRQQSINAVAQQRGLVILISSQTCRPLPPTRTYTI